MFRGNSKVILLTVVVSSAVIVTVVQYRKSSAMRDRLDCAASWLEKAKTLHGIQMKEPSSFTDEGMQKLMHSVDRAYDCATKEASHSRIAPGSGSFGQHGVGPH